MNLITPVEPAVLQQITTRQPARLTPGVRLSPQELSSFQVYTREELRRIGYEAASCDSARKLKGWADITRKPGERCVYTVVTKDGPRQIEMDGTEASTFNLAGIPHWVVPERRAPSGVTFRTSDRAGTIPPEQLATETEADWMLADVGPDFEIVSAEVASGGRTQITVAEGEARRPWVLRRVGRETQNYPVGLSIQVQYVGTAKGAPGKWSVDDLYGLRYTLLPVAETSTLGTVPVPVGALPDGVVVEDHGALAGGLQVFLPGAAETPGAAGDKLDQILQEVQGMRAELRELRALTGGAGVPWL